MRRYFAKKLVNNAFILSESDQHHIHNVMRNKIDDRIEVVWEDKLYIAKLNQDLVPLLEIALDMDVNTNNITIASALIKEQRWNSLLTRSTESGVSGIIPIITERTIVKVKDANKKRTRWEKIVKSASEQSKRLDIPVISDIINLYDLNVNDYDLCLIANPYVNTNIKSFLKEIDHSTNILICFGPEGGFTDSEIIALENKGFKSVRIGNYVLRCETAPVVAIGMINYELMEK